MFTCVVVPLTNKSPDTVKLFVIVAVLAVSELNVPTDVNDEFKTVAFNVFPVKVVAAAVTVISAPPLNEFLLNLP